MSQDTGRIEQAPVRTGTAPRLALVARNDPLTPHLHAALAQRFNVVADHDVELSGLRRAIVAALTFRPTWSRWADSYMKSNLGFAARSRLARRQLADSDEHDLIIQTHALFASGSEATMIYVDCTYHQALMDWPGWTPHRGRAQAKWLAAETEAFRRAIHIFAFTDETQRSLVEHYGIDPARVTVVGAGANFTEAADSVSSTDRREPVVLFVGKDFARKGGDVMLKAFELVRAEVPEARLQVVGTSLPGSTPPGVEVLGLVRERDHIAELYRHAAVFCLPSIFDPGPLVALEAMAWGLPCVLSRDASFHVRDVIATHDAGRIAPTGDAVTLARGIVEYLQDPQAARAAGERARAAVLDGFQWTDVVDRMAPAIEAATDVRSAVARPS